MATGQLLLIENHERVKNCFKELFEANDNAILNGSPRASAESHPIAKYLELSAHVGNIYHASTFIRLTLSEYFNIPIVLRLCHPLTLSIGKRVHGQQMRTGWSTHPTSLHDRHDQLNNMLFETRLSNVAKYDDYVENELERIPSIFLDVDLPRHLYNPDIDMPDCESTTELPISEDSMNDIYDDPQMEEIASRETEAMQQMDVLPVECSPMAIAAPTDRVSFGTGASVAVRIRVRIIIALRTCSTQWRWSLWEFVKLLKVYPPFSEDQIRSSMMDVATTSEGVWAFRGDELLVVS